MCKATVGFVMSVCPSILEQLGSHWTDIHEILYLIIFRKSVERTQVWLKFDKNTGTLRENLSTFMIIARWILLRLRNVSNKSCRKNKTHILYSINPLPTPTPENRVVCDIMWTDDNIIRRLHFACWMTKAAHTHTHTHTHRHTEYIILMDFPRQQWLRERAWMLRCSTLFFL